MTGCGILISFLTSLFASLVAIVLTLIIERWRMPKLVISHSELSNVDKTFPPPNAHANERWKFYRVEVENKSLPKYLPLISRQTAESCRAKIAFYKNNDKTPIFSFAGRWSSTLEVPMIPGQEMVKVLYPDPVTIPAGKKKEYLDIFVKASADKEAYGWNNESYLYNWRNPNYKLDEGEYSVMITIQTQVGLTFSKKINIAIRSKIENTIIISD